MSIEFNCPKCGALIAFADQHAGKRAHCATCQQRFIIPAKSHNTPETMVADAPDKGEPIPGFYKAALLHCWAVFFRRRSATALVFVVAIVCFKFFTAHVDYSFTMGAFRVLMPFGLIIRALAWGALFWYYLEVINAVAQDDDDMPDVDIDGGFDFLSQAVRSMCVFFMALLICLLPTTVYIAMTGHNESLAANLLANVGLFFLPMLLLAMGVNQDTLLLWRVDTLFQPVFKAFLPYLTCALAIMLVWFLQMHTPNYGDETLKGVTPPVISLYLGAQISIQFLALIAMRALGLFYRHYNCCFSW